MTSKRASEDSDMIRVDPPSRQAKSEALTKQNGHVAADRPHGGANVDGGAGVEVGGCVHTSGRQRASCA